MKTEFCMTSDGGTSDSVRFVIPIPVDQQKPVKKEEPEDEAYLCKTTSESSVWLSNLFKSNSA